MSAAAGFLPLYQRRVAIAVKTPVALVGQALMPILWVLVVGPALARAGAGSTDPDVDYYSYVAIGQIVFILPFSAMFAGLTVLNDRNVGVLRELLVAPIRRATIPLASIAAVLTIAAGQITLIVVLSVIRGAHFHLAVGPTLAALVAGGLLAGGIYALAEYLAYTLKQPQTFGTLIPAIGATPYLLCGALYPIATLPDGVRQFSWMPAVVARRRPAARRLHRLGLLPSRPDLAPALADRDGPPQPRRARRLRRPDGRARDARLSPRHARLASLEAALDVSLLGVRIVPSQFQVMPSRRWSATVVASTSSSSPSRTHRGVDVERAGCAAGPQWPRTLSRSPSIVTVSERTGCTGAARRPRSPASGGACRAAGSSCRCCRPRR